MFGARPVATGFFDVRSCSAALISTEERDFMKTELNSPQLTSPIVSVRFSTASPNVPVLFAPSPLVAPSQVTPWCRSRGA